MKDFVTFKKEIVSRCKAKGACMGEFQKLLAAENEYDLWLVLFSNYTWCDSRSIFTKEERIKEFVFPETVNGSINLSECDLTGITLPTTVGGYLCLIGCDLTGITLPKTVGGDIYLFGCNIPDTDQFKNFKNKMIQ